MIVTISSPSCLVSFDEYGNEEEHLLSELQLRTEEEEEEEEILWVPSPPPMPAENDELSATFMSWYLAGYHTGFYQSMKNKFPQKDELDFQIRCRETSK
ncbi:unnamed protein product [Didymodactylos carnosus]|uniref:Uncharacterized protein n=1 Tax=Didymodactylos carnosus TaxID=1234261 RepID=A0A815CNA7_9BILA|nr:unnamed protein product [Didymodactylos carnosus]CAF4095032.1 unnamed protein product [Didymodactylos carnosus]